MDEKPKNIWKKSWRGPRGLLLWFIVVFAVAFSVFFVIGSMSAQKNSTAELARFASICALSSTFVGISMVAFVRWIFHWHNFKRFLFGCACFVTLVALFYAEEDWRGKHDWEKFKREWEAKGEHFDFASVVPPPVPDDQNFAMQPIWVESIEAGYGSNVTWQWYGKKLTAQEQTNLVNRLDFPFMDNSNTNCRFGDWQKVTLTDLKPWQNYYRALATKTNLFPLTPQPQTPAQDVLSALSKYDSTIEELRAASKRRYSRFPLDYTNQPPFAILLPHLAALKRCTQVLELRSIAELQNDESQKALDDVKLSLQLIDSLRTEPFLISHLVRIAMLEIMLQPIYEGLAEHKWSDAQLVDLDVELAKLNFLADYEFSIRGERALSIADIDYMRRARIIETDNFHTRNAKIQIVRIVPAAFFYQNELAIAQMHQQFSLPMVNTEADAVFPKKVDELQIRATDNLNHHPWPYKIFAKMLLPALEKAVDKFTYAQSSVSLARVAIALERYRLAHGEYPDSLDVLAPKFIPEGPHDVINGEPLHYRKTAEGQFVLYSVGWNERDDGGVVVFGKGKTPSVNTFEGDWVWRYPANAE